MLPSRNISWVVLILLWWLQNCTLRNDVLWYIFACIVVTRLVWSILTYDYDYWERRGIFAPPATPVVGHIGSVATMKEQTGLPNKLRNMFPIIEGTASEFLIRVKKIAKGTQCEENNNEVIKSVVHSNDAIHSDDAIPSDDAIHSNNAIHSNDAIHSDNKVYKPVSVVDSDRLVGGFTADAIVPCAFGLKSNVMDNENDPFAVALHATMRQFWPAFVLFFKIRIIPKRTHDFFYNIVTKVLRERSTGEQEKRGDFIDMMMALQDDDIKIDDENDFKITNMIISANAFIIFLGGFETTSSTLAFLFLELAAHPGVQEKMRKEIGQVLEKHGELTYDALQELTYMEMRMCTKDYTIPGTTAVIEKGTIIMFPTLGIQRDDKYFENASQFIPERWADGTSPPLPGVYMPFGDGPRYCIVICEVLES
ncbi:unnamed protein product [Leptidea sinapis]|uniref:unspecific monooxygenase n=1 Tax=Leptidea sinapis TaxID=189913 RepID=A0A5E4QJU9_9NEOP|nr:unnamed protein product [Leptidea sinapis]